MSLAYTLSAVSDIMRRSGSSGISGRSVFFFEMSVPAFKLATLATHRLLQQGSR